MIKIRVKIPRILADRYLRKTILIVLFMMSGFAAWDKAQDYRSVEMKGVEIKYNSKKGTITYSLNQPCIVRQYLQIYEGPKIRFGSWEMKEAGNHEEEIINFPSETLDSEKIVPSLMIYNIPDRIESRNIDIGTLVKTSAIEADLEINISIVPRRLGQYVHDYQKNVKKIKVDVSSRDKDDLNTIKYAVDYNPSMIEKNIKLPYILKKDFSIFPKGKHRLFIEICGEDNAIGIGNLEIEVI